MTPPSSPLKRIPGQSCHRTMIWGKELYLPKVICRQVILEVSYALILHLFGPNAFSLRHLFWKIQDVSYPLRSGDPRELVCRRLLTDKAMIFERFSSEVLQPASPHLRKHRGPNLGFFRSLIYRRSCCLCGTPISSSRPS